MAQPLHQCGGARAAGRMGATGPDAGDDPLARWSERMEKQRRKDDEEAAKRQCVPSTPPPDTRTESGTRLPRRNVPSRNPEPPDRPVSSLPRPSSITPAPPASRRVRYTTIPTRTTHLQVHCFDNKGAYTADELLAEDATIRKSTAGATRRRMILHDRLARTIDGWRYELDEERAKPGRRAEPGATAVEELVQPRGYTARGEVVANSGGHHLRNQRTRHLNDQPRGRPPNRLGVVVDVDFTVRPVLSQGEGDRIGRASSGASRSPESREGGDPNPNASPTKRGPGGETSMEDRRRAAIRAARRPASATTFTPSPTRVLSVVGAASATGRPLTSRPAARGAGVAMIDAKSVSAVPRKLRETPMRPGAVETKRVATAREAAAKPAMVFGPPSKNGGGVESGEGGFHERVRMAAVGATAHSRILLETFRARPSSAPASRKTSHSSTTPLVPVEAAERVARAHGDTAAKECATRKTSTRIESARKQAFGYSFSTSTHIAAGDRTAPSAAPFAPRTATLAEKMCGARMNATATRLSAGRGQTNLTSSDRSRRRHTRPPCGFWRTDVTSHDTTEDLTRGNGNTDAFNVSARPMSPTVERAARPATARVNVRGAGAQPGHVFGAAMNAFTAVHTHDAAAHGGRVARGDVDIENVPLAGNGGPTAGTTDRPQGNDRRRRSRDRGPSTRRSPGGEIRTTSTRRCLSSGVIGPARTSRGRFGG